MVTDLQLELATLIRDWERCRQGDVYNLNHRQVEELVTMAMKTADRAIEIANEALMLAGGGRPARGQKTMN